MWVTPPGFSESLGLLSTISGLMGKISILSRLGGFPPNYDFCRRPLEPSGAPFNIGSPEGGMN